VLGERQRRAERWGGYHVLNEVAPRRSGSKSRIELAVEQGAGAVVANPTRVSVQSHPESNPAVSDGRGSTGYGIG